MGAFSLTTKLVAPQPRALVRMQEGVVAEAEPSAPVFSVLDLPGITGPLGFFDPLDFCGEATEGKIKFYREVELKHGRVAMLASLGFLVGENFHPLFGGGIDVPSYIAFQETPLQTFWPAVMLAISILEVFSVFSFNSPFGGEPWSIRSDYESGDLGRRVQGDGHQGAQQRPARDVRHRWHGWAGARHRQQALLVRPRGALRQRG